MVYFSLYQCVNNIKITKIYFTDELNCVTELKKNINLRMIEYELI